MDLNNLYSRCRSRLSGSKPEMPSPGETYYDVLRGSEVEVVRRKGEEDIIVLRYKDEGVERPFSEESWNMALRSGRFRDKSTVTA
jgi:hypothetical protein